MTKVKENHKEEEVEEFRLNESVKDNKEFTFKAARKMANFLAEASLVRLNYFSGDELGDETGDSYYLSEASKLRVIQDICLHLAREVNDVTNTFKASKND